MITGHTKIFYMLAHPIGHVRTPEIINPLFAARGADAVMVPVHYAPEDFAAAWDVMKKTRNLGGLVVSVPHKEQAFQLSDEVEQAAEELGAANVIRREPDGRMVATNMDGLGFIRGMLSNGADARNRDALLVGAGGAGKAIAFSLARNGVRSLRISDMDRSRAETLAEDVRQRYPALPVSDSDNNLDDIDLLVQATPCGLYPDTDPHPVDFSRLRPEILVADIIMKPRETPLLRAAIERGCEVRYGAGMLDSQIELMAEFFGC